MDHWEHHGNGGDTNEGSDTPRDDSREHSSLKKEGQQRSQLPHPPASYSSIPPLSFISPISTSTALSTTDTLSSYLLDYNDSRNNNHSDNTLQSGDAYSLHSGHSSSPPPPPSHSCSSSSFPIRSPMNNTSGGQEQQPIPSTDTTSAKTTTTTTIPEPCSSSARPIRYPTPPSSSSPLVQPQPQPQSRPPPPTPWSRASTQFSRFQDFENIPLQETATLTWSQRLNNLSANNQSQGFIWDSLDNRYGKNITDMQDADCLLTFLLTPHCSYLFAYDDHSMEDVQEARKTRGNGPIRLLTNRKDTSYNTVRSTFRLQYAEKR